MRTGIRLEIACKKALDETGNWKEWAQQRHLANDKSVWVAFVAIESIEGLQLLLSN